MWVKMLGAALQQVTSPGGGSLAVDDGVLSPGLDPTLGT